MKLGGIGMIAESNPTVFWQSVSKALEGKSDKDYRLNYSIAYHPNGEITFSALIEYFVFE